tara:strand:+ start:58 stop:213 length:156 start_codon:yes stop_codon:yes gene_type:complete
MKDRHKRASDRIERAFLRIKENTGKKIDIVVMVQGDELMMIPEMFDAPMNL